MTPDDYRRSARCVRVIDGDTLDLDVDLGFHTIYRARIRLEGINTPELRTGTPETKAAGRDARAFVEAWIGTGEGLVVQTTKTGKYGRWLARLWRTDGAELASDLLAAGLAVPYVV